MHKYKIENTNSTVERDLVVKINHILKMNQWYHTDGKTENLILGRFNRYVICKAGLVIAFLNSPFRSLSLGQFNTTVHKEEYFLKNGLKYGEWLKKGEVIFSLKSKGWWQVWRRYHNLPVCRKFWKAGILLHDCASWHWGHDKTLLALIAAGKV